MGLRTGTHTEKGRGSDNTVDSEIQNFSNFWALHIQKTKSQRKEERGQLTANEKIENYANILVKTSA